MRVSASALPRRRWKQSRAAPLTYVAGLSMRLMTEAIFRSLVNSGRLIVLSTAGNAPQLRSGHYYAYLGHNAATGRYQFYNPYGQISELTWSQIQLNFATLEAVSPQRETMGQPGSSKEMVPSPGCAERGGAEGAWPGKNVGRSRGVFLLSAWRQDANDRFSGVTTRPLCGDHKEVFDQSAARA